MFMVPTAPNSESTTIVLAWKNRPRKRRCARRQPATAGSRSAPPRKAAVVDLAVINQLYVDPALSGR